MEMSQGVKDKVEENDSLIQLKRDYWGARFPSKIESLHGRLSGSKIFECTQNLTHQPPVQYRINFIKFVIKQIESKARDEDDSEEDEAEKWYECLESVSGSSVLHEPFYRLYDFDEADDTDSGSGAGVGSGAGSGTGAGSTSNPIKIYEDEKAFVSDGSTGFITWIASLELAKWLTINQLTTSMNEKCGWAFEVGCGTGLLAIAIMKKFPHLTNYHATDVHPGVLSRCQQNILANELHDRIHVTPLDWVKDQQEFSNTFQFSSNKYKQPGILLGADVIFDVSVISGLRDIIQSFLRIQPVGKVFFSSAVRNETTLEEFQRQIRDSEMEINVVHFWDGKNGVIMEIKSLS